MKPVAACPGPPLLALASTRGESIDTTRVNELA